MKKLKLSIFLAVAIISAVLYSCKQDDFSESDAMKLQVQLDKQRAQNQDTLTTSTYRVSYTVNVVDASTSALKSASAVSAITGAVVKLVQDTTILKQTVDASGIVTFTNLKPGNANINITLPSYSEVNYTVNLSQNSINGGRQFSNIIPLIPISGTTVGKIHGKVIFESDLTNNAPEVVPTGTRVIAMVSANSSALPSTGSNGIVSISYDNLSLSATTKADGTFDMDVPATLRGLDYDIIVPDFTVDQKLLQNTYNNRDTSGVLTIAANFGNSFQSASTVSAGSPVIVKIGAPNYTNTSAVATAVIDNPNTIEHINLTSNGGLYTQHAGYTLTLDNASIVSATTVNATATFDVNSYGRVTNISVSGGSKYLAAADNFALTIPYCKTEAVVNFNTDASGVITGLNSVVTAGKFYFNDPASVSFTFNGSQGSGATFTPIFTYGSGGYYISGVTVNNGGTGYPVSATNVSFNIKASGALNQAATGTLHMTTGSVSAINVTNEGANYIGAVDVVIGAPDVPGGTQATATAVISNGKISAINITNAGSGYTSVPSISIKNKAEAIQAKYTGTASANGNVSSTFTTVNQGNGYLTVPSVTLESSIPGAGSGASAYAVVSGGKVTSLTLINAGNGYRGNIPSSSKSYGPPSVTVKGNGTTIINIDLGTGKRTIEQ